MNNMFFKSSSCLSRRELIRYGKGRLGGEARYRVEKHLLDCPLCSAAVEGIADSPLSSAELHATWRGFRARNARNKDQTTHVTRSRQLTGPYKLGIAAIVLLLIVVSAYAYHRHTLGDRLFETYFTHQPLHMMTNVRGAVEGNSIATHHPLPAEGLAWYRLGEYDKSYASFSHHLEQYPEDSQAKIMTALAAMSMGELSEADLLLAEVLSTQDTLQVNEARWYLALSALRQHKIKYARKLLERLAREDTAEFQSIAQEVLRQLPKS